MVPKGWTKSDLSEWIKIKHGFAFKSEHFSDHGSYILLTPGNFYETGGFRDQGVKKKYYHGEFPKEYLLSKGDLLIAMTEQAHGLLGSALFVPEEGKYLHNQRLGLVNIINKKKVCPEFLYYLFNFPPVRKQISDQSAGTKVKHTSPDRLCSVVGLIPPLEEQKEIATILSVWDEAISAAEQLLANSERQKKALMQQLLTGRSRLPGFEAEWDEVTLEGLLREKKQWNKNGAIERVLTVSNKYGFTLPEKHFSKRVASQDISRYKVVRRGDFGYNPSRINVGSFARLDSYEEGVLSPMYVVLNVDEERLNSDYFLAWMNSNEAKQRISSSTQGTVRNSVSFNALCRFPFRLPSIQEQNAIAHVALVCDKQVARNRDNLELLKIEKKALMQELLTGKRRVKVDEAERATA